LRVSDQAQIVGEELRSGLGDLLAWQCDVAREIVRAVTSAASLASVPAPPVSRADRLSGTIDFA